MLAEWWQDSTLVYWIVGFVLFYYLGSPVMIYFNVNMAAMPPSEELDMQSLDPQLAQFLMEKTNALFDLGFDEPTMLHLPQPASQVNGYMILLVNRTAGDMALVTALISMQAQARQTCYVEFVTSYENQHSLNTQNSSELPAFAPRPLAIRTQVPSLTDVTELYRLHQWMTKKAGIASRKEVYEPEQALHYLKYHCFKEGYDEQVKRGLLRYDAGHDCYRFTLKGAYLTSWGQLQPMKYFRTVAMRKREQAVLAEFRQAMG